MKSYEARAIAREVIKDKMLPISIEVCPECLLETQFQEFSTNRHTTTGVVWERKKRCLNCHHIITIETRHRGKSHGWFG